MASSDSQENPVIQQADFGPNNPSKSEAGMWVDPPKYREPSCDFENLSYFPPRDMAATKG